MGIRSQTHSADTRTFQHPAQTHQTRPSTCAHVCDESASPSRNAGTYAPCSVHRTAWFDHHRHDRVFVRPAPFLVYAHNLVNLDIAHEVARDEHEVGGDDAVRVDVAHRVARRERLLRGDDGHDFDARRRF